MFCRAHEAFGILCPAELLYPGASAKIAGLPASAAGKALPLYIRMVIYMQQ